MKILHTLTLFVTVIPNSNELVSQSSSYPDDERSGSPYHQSVYCQHYRPPSPPRRIPQSPVEPELHQRTRSRSPSARPYLAIIPDHQVLGYGFGQLGLIRLIPNINKSRRFEFRRRTFHPDSRSLILTKRNVYEPLPNIEQIVLATSNGDAFAILKTDGVLIGIYTNTARRYRAKIRIENDEVIQLTKAEMEEVPVGPKRAIHNNFRVAVSSHNSLQLNE